MVAKLSDRVGGEEFPRPIVVGENLLYNANFKINQAQFAGGQPAAGVYGFDGWLGSPDGLQIQQIVENDSDLTGDYAISWEGGTGTASVNGTAGLASGDIVQLTTSGNFSVIVPTDATKIKFEQFGVTPYQEPRFSAQLATCQRSFYAVSNLGSNSVIGAGQSRIATLVSIVCAFPTTMRAAPIISTNATNSIDYFSAEVGNTDQTNFSINLVKTSLDAAFLSFVNAAGAYPIGYGAIARFGSVAGGYLHFDARLYP